MSWAVAIAESNLADLAARQGDIERALHFFEASRRHFEHDEAWGDLGRVDTEEATMLSTLGLTDVARVDFTSAIGRLRAHGAPADLAAAEIAYATALLDAGEMDAARDALFHTKDRIDRDQNIDLYRQLLFLQARIAIARGHFDEAERLVDDGYRLVEGLPIQRLRWMTLQAASAESAGELGRAREILGAALPDAEAARVTPLVGEIHESLSRVSRALGDVEPADAHARRAIAAFETVRGTIQANRLRQSWHHERLSVYASLYQSLIGNAEDDAQAEAFNVAERIRGRMLLDALHRDAAASAPDEAVSPGERALLERHGEHRRWLNWTYSALADGLEPEASLLAEVRDRELAANQLADRLATLRPRSRVTTPLELDCALDRIDETTAILSYLTVGESMSVQVVTRAGTTGVPDIASTKDLEDQAASLQFQVGRALVHGDSPTSPRRQARLQRDADAVLSRLYDTLVAPIEHLLAGMTRIIVVPSGNLHAVPFAALRREGEYLVDRMELVTAPSLSVLAAMRLEHRGRRFAPEHPLVVAVPDEYAPGLLDEARAVSARFSRATVLLEREATRGAVLDAMSRADLAHLACHGRFDPLLPNASGLRVADGWLTLDQLSSVRMEHPLLVLSGCETGRVRVDEGDDLEGMMAALIAAGAGGLVTSLWKTHDAAATSLVLELYGALERQHHPAAALRHAQRTVRANHPHPAMWAPFVALHHGKDIPS
jgi:CHAT domain-containing protein/tetratricopeptide (TPR) repeat protein